MVKFTLSGSDEPQSIRIRATPKIMMTAVITPEGPTAWESARPHVERKPSPGDMAE